MDFENVKVYPHDLTARDVIQMIKNDRQSVPGDVAEDAFIVGDLSVFLQAFTRWKRCMPRVKPFYAVKANSHPTVLKFLSRLDIGFDCANKHEIKFILDLGVEPSRISYSHTRKQPSHLRYARSVGVNLTIFDSEAELENIKRNHPDANLMIRIATTTNENEKALSGKYGCPSGRLFERLNFAKTLKLNVIGVHFHIRLGIDDPIVYSKSIKTAREAFDIGKELGFKMKLLDIGGGFPNEFNPNYDFTFREAYEIVNEALDVYFPDEMHFRIIAEPGTYLAMGSCHLAASVIGKDRITVDEIQLEVPSSKTSPQCIKYQMEYYINDGCFSSFGRYFIMSIEPMAKTLDSTYDDKPRLATRIWGQSCAHDLVCTKCRLPELDFGDWIIFPDMGGYSFDLATTFNGFQKPEIYWTISEANRTEYEELLGLK